MNNSDNINSRTSSSKKMRVPNYDANQTRIKINKIIEEKSAQKLRRKIKLVFSFILIGIVVSILYVILKIPYFDISNIEVEGNEIYTSEQIISQASSNIGNNIFVQKLFGKINLNLPYIESVKVKVKLPSTLKLVVKERASVYFAFDKENNVYYKLDKSGYILERCENVDSKQETEYLVTGIAFNKDLDLATSPKIDDSYLSYLNYFETIKSKFQTDMKDYKITSVNFGNFLTTITLDDKLSVKFSESNDINYSISLLKVIIEKLPEGSAGVIDMTKTDPIFSSY